MVVELTPSSSGARQRTSLLVRRAERPPTASSRAPPLALSIPTGQCDADRLPRRAGLRQSLAMRRHTRAVFVLALLAPALGCGRGSRTPDYPSLLEALRSPEPGVRGPA